MKLDNIGFVNKLRWETKETTSPSVVQMHCMFYIVVHGFLVNIMKYSQYGFISLWREQQLNDIIVPNLALNLCLILETVVGKKVNWSNGIIVDRKGQCCSYLCQAIACLVGWFLVSSISPTIWMKLGGSVEHCPWSREEPILDIQYLYYNIFINAYELNTCTFLWDLHGSHVYIMSTVDL